MEKGEPSYTDSGNVHWCSPCGKQYESSSEKNYPYDPAIPLLDIYPDKTIIQTDNIHPYVQSSTIHDSQDMETTLNVYQ